MKGRKKNLRKSKQVEKRYDDIVLDGVQASQEPGFESAEQAEQQCAYTLDGVGHDYYFASYSHFQIHEDMLKDEVRTLAYRDAILKNWHLFQGKTVLDIGCGTGILSIFAAKAGAKHVYAIENASIALHAQQILKQNGLDKQVTVLKGKVEEVELPVDQVDIIISEWMGYFLLYESMLDTVLFARDKWLAPSGIMLPDRCVMKVALAEDAVYRDDKTGFWDSVYGVDMSAMKPMVMREPSIDVLNKAQVVSSPETILDIDLQTVTQAQLDFSTSFETTFTKTSDAHALVGWFDSYFSHSHSNIILSTSPFSRRTHWKQTVFYLHNTLKANKAQTVQGRIALKKAQDNPRQLNIKIGLSGQPGHNVQYYQLA